MNPRLCFLLAALVDIHLVIYAVWVSRRALIHRPARHHELHDGDSSQSQKEVELQRKRARDRRSQQAIRDRTK